MGKRNVTLSVDEETVKKAKMALVASRDTMSNVLEEALKSKITTMTISALAAALNIKIVKLVSGDIPRLRPMAKKGFKSLNVVKQMRQG